jgi:ABC-type transport system involved in cytochrome c biogenesis permease subunit
LHELRPGVSKLFELAREYSTIDEKQRSSLQQQVFLLAQNVDEYARLASHADFARARIAVGPGDGLTRIFGGQEETTFSQVLAKIGDLARLQGVLGDDAEHATERKSVTDVLHATIDLTSGTESLALIPPSAREPSQAAWHSPADIVVAAFDGAEAAPEHVEILAAFERLAQLRDRPTEFAGELQTLAQRTESMASARAEYGKIGLEVAYYKAKLLTRGLATFILAFVLVSVMWMRPRNRWLYLATNAAAVVATTLLIAAIVMRCIIRERPPVSTLYETVLFVTAVGTSVAIAMEWINRQRVALSAAVAMGIIGLFIANGYEMLDKRDTMPSLVAVLDTNFWLSTHVTSITVGYSAGMLAALLATIYLIGRMIPRVRAHASFGKTLARMVYGALSFSLVFSVVGTILGGIWANESWGRFWGWDPKENGAMLICLAEIAILHGRMGGYLRDFGVAMACGFNGTVIAFSWWGVNLLGVGLHSYGFTSGIHTALWSYYLAQ